MPTYFDLQNSPVLTTPSTLTVPKITSIGYPGDDTAADTAGGQTITLTGSGFVAGASVIINGAAVGVVSVVSSTTITFTSPAQSAGSYVLYVVNTDGSTAVAVPGIQYSGTPTWTTAAGSLGSYTETVAIANTVTATGDAPVTYSVFSGSLPTGATLNSANGYISGTSPLAASPTTYTFTIRATDAQQQDTNRSFSLTINPDVVTWSSPANGTTYTSVANTALANVPLSASAASGKNITYTANALPTGLSISGSNITGTPTVVANSSTLLTATAATTNATATRTINWVISVASDTYFPYVTSLLSASTPTSTFVTDASTNGFAVTVNGDTRPSNFGPYTPGYYSNYFDGNGDYLATPSNAALAFGSGDFCLEFWMYPTAFNTNTSSIGNSNTWAANSWSVLNNHSTAPQKWTFFVYNYNTSSALLTSTSSALLNAWTHVAITRSGSSWRMFINGVQEGGTITSSVAMDGGSSNIFYICGDGNPSSYTPGYMSNVRAVKGAAVYTSNFTPSTTPLTAIANTSLLTCQSNRFIDNSTNNFTITRNGDTLISGFDPFLPSSSYAGYGSGFFDGTGDYLTLPASQTALQPGSGDFTIELWYYTTVTPGGYVNIFSYGAAGNVLRLFFATNNQLTVWTGSTPIITVNNAYATSAWNHVAIVRNGVTVTLYVNGTSVGTATGGSTTNYVGDLSIAFESGQTPFTGYMSNFRMVKGTAVYTTNFTPPTAPLTAVANTQLLTLQNNQPNNNSMFLDSSSNNFNITRNGNTTQGTFSPYGGGWSNFFNGSTDYFSMSDNNAFQYGAGDFALECWVYPTATLSGNYIVSQWYTGDKGVILGVAGGSLSFYYSTTGSNDIILVSATNPALNQWSHLLACRTGNTISLYLNGTRVATTTESGTLYNSTSTIGIATHVQGLGSSLWPGYISNLRSIAGSNPYNAAQTTITVPTAPLTAVANTRLLICADNRFIDDGPSNFTLTRAGTPSIQRFNPFNPVLTTPTSYSGYFDGTGDYLSVATANAAGLSKFLTGNFTVECWAYLTDSSVDRTIISAVYLWAAGANYNIEVRSGALLHVQIGNGITLTSGTVSWPLNQWNHIALVRTNTTSTTLYLNGVSVATSSTNWTADEDCPVTVGCFNINGGSLANYWNGYISNLRIVNGTGVYTGNFTPPTAPLTAIANTSFLTLQSATIIDNSVNNVSITSNGDTAPRQFNPFGWTTTTGSGAAYTPALYGGSMYCGATSAYGRVAMSGADSFGTGNFTVECWLYPSNSAINISIPSVTTNSWAILTYGSQLYWQENGGNLGGTGYGTVPLNTWTHLAVARSGSTIRLFVNGVQVYSASNSFNYSGSPATRSVGPGDGGGIPAYISDFRVIKGTARYTSNFQPPIAPLTALQNTVLLNNMTGAGIYDSSMMNDYETVGNASINTALKKYGNTSMYFDGTGDYLVAAATNLPFTFGTGDFTIECWIYPASVNSSTITIVSNRFDAGADTVVFFGFGTSHGLYFHTQNTQVLNSGVNATVNTWQHVVLCRASGTVRIFLNGTQVGSSASSAQNLSATVPVFVGQDGTKTTGVSAQYNGYIDDLRITKGVARYTSNFTPPTTPFITN